MIEWEPGKGADGRIQLAGSKPAYVRSTCGRYTVARVFVLLEEGGTKWGWRCELSHIVDGVAENLASRVVWSKAVELAEGHAHGLHHKAA